jgi:uncharacterized protein YndB with AHSA1/START domain
VPPTSTVDIHATPEAVFAVLADPRTYPQWLVGAKRIRAVEGDWPRPGSTFHHTVGFGPATINDHTDVLEVEEPRMLLLKATIGPFGSFTVKFTLVPTADGTEVTFEEAPCDGAVRSLWRLPGGRALERLSIWGRNKVSAQQLKQLVEERAAAVSPSGPERHADGGR